MFDYSVLMTVFEKDSPDYFKQGVNSMLNQTVKTNDFVLVCDGPITDELEKVIEEVFAGYEDILNLVRLPQNVGLGQALNQGLLLCKNEWVARMDDDDISHPKRCEIELKYIEDNPFVSIVGSYVNEFDSNVEKPVRIKKVPTTQDEILKYSKRRNPFNHSSVMIKKSDIIAAGNYSLLRTNQDVETWIRVLNKGYKGANIDQALVDFRFNEDTYYRRKDWKNIKLLLDVWKGFRKQKYCSLVDYLFVVAVQTAMFLMPQKLLEWVYNRFR